MTARSTVTSIGPATNSMPAESSAIGSDAAALGRVASFVPLTPARVLDTRAGAKVGNATGTAAALEVMVLGKGGLPCNRCRCGVVERHRRRRREPHHRRRLRHRLPVRQTTRRLEPQLHLRPDHPQLGARPGLGQRHHLLLRLRHRPPPRRRLRLLPLRERVHLAGADAGVGHTWLAPRSATPPAPALPITLSLAGSGGLPNSGHRCRGVERHRRRRREPDHRWRLRHRLSVRHTTRRLQPQLHLRTNDPQLGDRPGVGQRHHLLLRLRHRPSPRRRLRLHPLRFEVHLVGADAGVGHRVAPRSATPPAPAHPSPCHWQAAADCPTAASTPWP